ncbi:uncharacterized protein LOC117747533 [Cyclopterus lumpus]|uniref:AIG1-type G domain-containing protein n=1 Tax=Cyclopterus lumpus TaxID=8103 RepID=A0A8C2XF30_CYCLU|nr:uncharacterized protein LOC117747533 [Cyclopterus lumpus]
MDNNSLTEQSDSMETHSSSDDMALSRDAATDQSEACGEGKAAGVADADSGMADADAGVAAADSGVADADSGVADADSGVADADAGVAAADSGVADADSGMADADAGVAAADSGVADADAGVAAADSGVADADAGVAAALQDAALQHDNSLKEQSDSMETHSSSDDMALSRDAATDQSEACGEGKAAGVADAGVADADSGMADADAGMADADSGVADADAGMADADAGVADTDAGMADADAGMADADAWRIVLLGKTGVGKSSLANNIFGEAIFKINNLSDLETHPTTVETKYVHEKNITLIDTPGFFDPSRSEKEMKPEMMRCSTECAPGPHVFLIVLKVEKFIEHNEAVVSQMCDYFSKDALKYVVIVFTHGDQLPEGMTLEKYIEESGDLGDLVKKCGGRCHVVDNKYWKDNTEGDRSNQVQVEKLLCSINQIVVKNKGRFYTDKKLREVEKKIQKERKVIRLSSGNMSEEEIRKQAKSNVFKEQVDDAAQTWNFGIADKVWSVVNCVKRKIN